MPTKKATAAKKGAGKKAPAKKKAAPTTKKAAAKKTPAKKASAKSAPAKKGPVRKSPSKKRPAAKKTAPSTKATAAKKNATATKKSTKKSSTKTSSTRQAPATKAPAAATPLAPRPSGMRRSGGFMGSTPVAAGKKITKSPYDKKFLDSQKAMLLEERNDYTRQADVLQAEADSLTADREPGDVQFDEESGEGDTLAVERERDLALSAQARAAVEEIDAALARIEAGVYGICRVSGTAIPKERLKAIPWATERVEYKVGGFSRR